MPAERSKVWGPAPFGCLPGTPWKDSEDSEVITVQVAVETEPSPVVAVDFHENCTLMAAATKHGRVILYDFKKQRNIQELSFDSEVRSLRWDETGKNYFRT